VAGALLENFFDQGLGNVTLERTSSAQLFHALNRVIDPKAANATEQKSREHGYRCEKEAAAIIGQTGKRQIHHGHCNNREQRKNWTSQKRNYAPPDHPSDENEAKQ